MSEWYLSNDIQAELSTEWFDKPEIVAELQLDPDMIRQDFTMKSNQGYLGQIKDNKGYTMTEQSIDVDLDLFGEKKKYLMPLLVPGLNNEEIAAIKANEKDTPAALSAYDKAVEHGKQRLLKGKDPFFQEGEDVYEKYFYTDDRNIVLDSDEVPIGNVGKEVNIPQNKKALDIRNVKNNNLGNIKLTSDKWQGMVDNPDEKTFVTFKTPEHGIRALAKVVQANLNATDSYETYVNRYASEPNEKEYFKKNGKLMPHLENYAKLLAKSQGVDVSKPDWVKQKPSDVNMKEWIKATARAEGGSESLSYFTDEVIQKGLDLLK